MSVGYAAESKEGNVSNGDDMTDGDDGSIIKKTERKEIPTFQSLESWEPVKSTKVDTCARICRHLLTRDDAPSITFEDGRAIFPQIPPPPPGDANLLQETKILIYQEFTSLRPLLCNVTFNPCLFNSSNN